MATCVQGHLSTAERSTVRPVLPSNDSHRPPEPSCVAGARMAGALLHHTGSLGPQNGHPGTTMPCDIGQRLLTVHGEGDSIYQ